MMIIYFDDEFRRFLHHSEYRVLNFARDMLPVEHELLTTETILSSKAESVTIQDPMAISAVIMRTRLC